MEIAFDRSPFLPQATDLLRELAGAGFFAHGLLIGSWPMVVYSEHFTLPYGLATNDIDFAVEHAVKVPTHRGETIPQILGKQVGSFKAAKSCHNADHMIKKPQTLPGNFTPF